MKRLGLAILTLAWLALLPTTAAAQDSSSIFDMIMGPSSPSSPTHDGSNAPPASDEKVTEVLNQEALTSWREGFMTQWNIFFKKDPFLITGETFAALWNDLLAVGSSAKAFWLRLVADPISTVMDIVPGFVLAVCLLVVMILGEQRIRIWVLGVRERVRAKITTDWMQLVALIGLHIGALIAMPLVLQVVATLGAEVLYGENPRLGALVRLGVLLLLVYRLAVAVLLLLLHPPLAFLDEALEQTALERLLKWTLRLTAVLATCWFLVSETSYRNDVAQLMLLMLQCVFVVATISLSVLKREVLGLLPTGEPGSVAERLRMFAHRYYRSLLGLSVALTILWAIGFTRAATFLLVRGYAILALLSMAGVLQRRIDAWIRVQQQQTRNMDRRARLVYFGRALNTILLLVCVAVMLILLRIDGAVLKLIDTPLLKVGHISLLTLGKAVALLVIFVAIGRALRSLLNHRVYPRFGIDVGVAYAINTVLHYGMVVLGLFAGLTALEIPGSSLVFLIGPLSFGIGFGFQDIAKNLISGFIILFGRAVKKGDTVQIGDNYGVIEAVGARSVTLMTPEQSEVVIPSSELVSQAITNYSYSSPQIRLRIPVGVHYNSDVRHVEQALLNAALRHEEVRHEPSPSVWFNGFGDNSINFELLVWIDVRRISIPRLRGELNFHIWDVLKEQGIEIPYPQRDLHLKPTPDLKALIHAVRGEAPPRPSQEPERPELIPMPSYLNRNTHKVSIDAEATQRKVLTSVRDLGSISRRNREIREAIERFFTARQGSIETQARLLRDTLEGHPIRLRDSPMDRKLPDDG
ncbi:MAG: mechanosensitive ion channel domain-containing protein [Myxococcota bacterium]